MREKQAFVGVFFFSHLDGEALCNSSLVFSYFSSLFSWLLGSFLAEEDPLNYI